MSWRVRASELRSDTTKNKGNDMNILRVVRLSTAIGLFVCSTALIAAPPPPGADPGLKVIGLGTQLGHVLEEQDKEIAKAKQTAIDAMQSLQRFSTDPSGPVQMHVRAGHNLDQQCPQGTPVPHDKAVYCNKAIDDYNDEDKRLSDEMLRRKGEGDRIVGQSQENVARLLSKKEKVQSLLDSIQACAASTTMKVKACLDHLYDNASLVSSEYDLDPMVVKPGPFGTKQVSPEGVIKMYKESGDDSSQIRKIMQKKTTVPPPSTGG